MQNSGKNFLSYSIHAMGIKNTFKHINWDIWGNAAFLSFCISTIFMIFFSTCAVIAWPHPWNRVSILAACFTPMALVSVWKGPQWIRLKEIKKEMFFVPALLLLGIFNIILSEAPPVTVVVMTLFLITGISIFVVSGYLLNTEFRQRFFFMLCWVCLLIICAYGIYEKFSNNSVLLLSFNPIPAGSLLILLLVGPLALFPSSSGLPRFLLLATIILSITVIILIGKRGPLLGLMGMAVLPVFMLKKKKAAVAVLLTVIIVFGIGYKMRSVLPSTLTRNIIGSRSLNYRLENYPFAWHVFLKKPFFGTGLRTPLFKYLNDYNPKFTEHIKYFKYIKRRKTLENILLTAFVNMGGLFSILYIALIIYLLKNVLIHIKKPPGKRVKIGMLLLPLFGFLIHSMTYDSLLVPHLNWLFHSFLGLISNFREI